MILPDVNVLVYAFRHDMPEHPRYHAFIERLMTSSGAYGFADEVAAAFLRIVTNRRIYEFPAPVSTALEFLDRIRSRENCVPIFPGPRRWQIFCDLCRSAGATANLIPDAFLAALAIESGSELATADRGFGRYPGLRWRHPLDEGG